MNSEDEIDSIDRTIPYSSLITIGAGILLFAIGAFYFIQGTQTIALTSSNLGIQFGNIGIAAFGLGLVSFGSSQRTTYKSRLTLIDLKNQLNEIKSYLEDKDNTTENTNNTKKFDDVSISEEDKIIIEHLFERFRYSLAFGDTIDTKYAQMIALNGLILSVILIKRIEVGNFLIYIIGVACIIGAIILGVYGYKTTEWCVGAKDVFFKDWGNKFSSKEGIKKLKNMLAEDIGENKTILKRKTEIFDYMLYLNIVGLVIVVIGYYV